jgi:long-chain fatty acid transport protein
MRSKHCFRAAIGALGVAGAFGAGMVGMADSAWASGFALREGSAEGLGNAYAGQTAKADVVSTVFYNPAGMSNLDETVIGSSTTLIAPQAKFSGSNSNPLGGYMGGKSAIDATPATVIGSVFGVLVPQNAPDWRLGLSVTVPYGLRSEYSEDWVGRYQALNSSVTDIEVSPVVSYQVTPKLSLGGGPRFDFMTVKLSQAINFNGIGTAAALAYNSSSLASLASTWGDGQARMQGTAFSPGYVLSALYKLDDESRVGITYRSRVFHDIEGNVNYQTPSTLSLVPSVASSFVSENARAKLTTPDSLVIGYYRDLNKQWAVMMDASWTDWSRFKVLNVLGADGRNISTTNENWRDTYYVALGANYRPSERWVLHSGIAFDESPVTESNRTARIPDSNRYWTAIGVSYRTTEKTWVHFAYAHLFADKATIRDTQAAAAVAGTLTGTYNNSVDLVSASFTVAF